MRKSIVWRFYNRLESRGQVYAVVCELCNTQYKFFGNTTNLRNHLKLKHPIQWELLTTGTLDETISKSFHETGNDDDETDQEADQSEDHEASAQLAQSMQNDSDEEWLEDPFERVITEPIKQRSKRMRIKRELESPINTPAPRKQTKYLTSNGGNGLHKNPIIISNAKDEYSVFGEYVANKVRKFKSPKTQGNIQQLITTILWQAQYGYYDSPESIRQVLLMHSTDNRSASPEKRIPDEDIVVQEIQVHSGNLEVNENENEV